MSFDRQIDQVCPHTIAEEALFPGFDRQTVRPLRPVSSIASMKVLLNHDLVVPSFGVAIPGQAVGTKAGPFNITQGVNDTLVFQINGGPFQTAVIPAAAKIPTDRIVLLLNQQVSGISFSNFNNRIAFRTNDEGRDASVFFSPASTITTTLGIVTPREFRGQQVVPGWTMITDPNSIPERPFRLLMFDAPLRSDTDVVELSYATVQQECRRCGGSGVENDWRYSTDGDVVAVVDEALLIQEIQKLMFTVLGTNPFHVWYGTGILDAIGKKLTAGGFVQNLIVSDIYQAFERWQSIKKQQEEKAGQFVSDREFPFRLLSVNLTQSQQDPTVIFVDITIQNRSTDPIQLTRGLKIPQPTDLLGSSAAQGTIRQSLSNFVLTG